MKDIRLLKKPQLKNPVLIAAWPGMGDVALKAAQYLKEKLNAEEFAQMPAADYFQPSGVWIDEGLISIPAAPEGRFYFYKNPRPESPDLIIFLSDTQPFMEKAHSYACAIVDFAKAFKVRRLYTFAAMPMPMEHTQPPQVHICATDKSLMEDFTKMALKPMPSGQISGLNGLILGVAKARGLDGACLLGEIPLYTIQIENPMASMAVLEVVAKVLGIDLDLSSLREHAARINEEIEHLIDYLKNPPEEERPIDEKEIDLLKKGLESSSSLPESVKTRINELFRMAKKDLSKAMELKKELDKWNVYEQYEDSFLDLFRLPPKKSNN